MKNFKPNLVRSGRQNSQKDSTKKYEPITNYMAKELITFRRETAITEVIETLLEKRISGAPVLDKNNEILGVIDDKDCLQVLVDSAYHNLPVSNRTVDVFMTDVFNTISIDADIVDAAVKFLKSTSKRFLVVDQERRLKGQISRRDILRAIRAINSTEWPSHVD